MLTTYHHPVPLSRNLGALTSWNPLGLSRPVMGLLYLYLLTSFSILYWFWTQLIVFLEWRKANLSLSTPWRHIGAWRYSSTHLSVKNKTCLFKWYWIKFYIFRVGSKKLGFLVVTNTGGGLPRRCLHSFLISAPDAGEWSTSCPRCLTPGNNHRYPWAPSL